MKLLLFDNYDSFTHNIAHELRQIGVEPEIYRNDEIDIDAIEKFDKIIISPGPGIPSEAGILLPMLKRYASHKPVLGICLGHQAIGECFGAKLRNLDEPFHGVESEIRIAKDDYLFENLPERIRVGRYHSWVVDPEGLPNTLEVIARDGNGEIMALRHRNLDVRGLQFHPESIMTPDGRRILKNWIVR